MNLIIENHQTLASTSSTEYADIESANKFNEKLHDRFHNEFHIGMNQNEYERSDILYNNCQKFITPFQSQNINYVYQLFMLLLIIVSISFFLVYLITRFWLN